MQRDSLYLRDIVEAADAIGRFIEGQDRDGFFEDELLQSAVLHKLTIIGEAAARLSPEIQQAHAEVPWKDIVGFRNIVVHAYFSVDLAIVWTAATVDAPRLRDAVSRLLTETDGQ